MEFPTVIPEPTISPEAELLECLLKIGKGLIASGIAVGVVENTLTEIALAYSIDCEIMALPNYIMIELGPSAHGQVDFAVQRLTTLQLDQVSELGELIDEVRQKTIPPVEAAAADRSHPRQNTAFQLGDDHLWVFSLLYRADHAFPA